MDDSKPMNHTTKAFQSMGKCVGGIRYVPEEEMLKLELKLANTKALCERMTDDVDGLTDEDIASIAERHADDPKCLQVYIKFLIGLYHKEKGKAQYLEARLKEATNGRT